MFFTFLKLYKWYQIVQSVLYRDDRSLNLYHISVYLQMNKTKNNKKYKQAKILRAEATETAGKLVLSMNCLITLGKNFVNIGYNEVCGSNFQVLLGMITLIAVCKNCFSRKRWRIFWYQSVMPGIICISDLGWGLS